MSKTMVYSTVSAVRELPEFRLDLGVQYSNGSRYPAALEPEIRLMVMILEDALQCYQRYCGARQVLRRREFLDAKRWIFGPDEDWIFSFSHICAFIGIEPEYLRDGLRRWKKTGFDLTVAEDMQRSRHQTGKLTLQPADPR